MAAPRFRPGLKRVDYSLACSPPTYDFLTVLAAAARDTAPDVGLIVNIMDGKRNWAERDTVIAPACKAWRQKQLFPGLCELVPAVEQVVFDILPALGQSIEYVTHPYVFSPVFRAPNYAVASLPKLEPYITFTVRQSWFQAARDTHGPTWDAVIKALPLPVVVVPDTEATMARQECSVSAGSQYVPAAFSPALRMALYEGAVLNLFTTGGPMMLAPHSNIKAECFGLHVEGVKSCKPDTLTRLGLTDGRVVGSTRFHWGVDRDMALAAVKERLT